MERLWWQKWKSYFCTLPKGRVPDLKKTYPDLARGYSWDVFENSTLLTEQTTYEEMLYPYGGGSIMSTVSDLHRWNVALYEKFKVLPKTLVALMTTAHIKIKDEVYGYGLKMKHTVMASKIRHMGMVS